MFAGSLFNTFVAAWLALAAVIFAVLWFVTAPYGRFSRRGWGATVPAALAWLLMEAPSPLLFAAFFVAGPQHSGAVAWVFLLMWEAHYVHRAFVYPWTAREAGRRMPAGLMCMALLSNTVNAIINGHWLFGPLRPGCDELAGRPAVPGRVGALRRRLRHQPLVGHDTAPACATRTARATASRRAACTAGSRVPTTLARSSSGRAGRSLLRPSPALPSPLGRQPTWCRGRAPTSAGIGLRSRTTRRSAGHWCQGCGKSLLARRSRAPHTAHRMSRSVKNSSAGRTTSSLCSRPEEDSAWKIGLSSRPNPVLRFRQPEFPDGGAGWAGAVAGSSFVREARPIRPRTYPGARGPRPWIRRLWLLRGHKGCHGLDEGKVPERGRQADRGICAVLDRGRSGARQTPCAIPEGSR